MNIFKLCNRLNSYSTKYFEIRTKQIVQNVFLCYHLKLCIYKKNYISFENESLEQSVQNTKKL
jgi:hypothetical protein